VNAELKFHPPASLPKRRAIVPLDLKLTQPKGQKYEARLVFSSGSISTAETCSHGSACHAGALAQAGEPSSLSELQRIGHDASGEATGGR
jgi:hypothetical protein